MLGTLLALVGCLVATSAALDAPHLYVEKSLSRALRDCMEYLQIPTPRYADYASNHFPSDPETKCLVRCVGLSLRWWNDTTGVQTALMVNFFQPDPTDDEHVSRTSRCLEERLAFNDPSDCCSLAYESFMCYLQYYGNLVLCPRFLPEDHSRHVRMAYDCMNFLQVPETLLHSYSKGHIRDAPETRCLLRCFYLRSGVFNVATGFDLDRLYARDFEQSDDRYLAPDTYSKLHNLRSSGYDECTEVYLAYRDLLAELGNAHYEDSVLRDAAVLALAGDCGTKPCRYHEQPIYEEPSYEEPATTKSCPKKYYKKHPEKACPPKHYEVSTTTHCPQKHYEEPATTHRAPKYHEEPSTTHCPPKHYTEPPTTKCPPKYHEEPSKTHCPPDHYDQFTTTSSPPAHYEEPTTTETPTTKKVFDYKQLNCQNCGKMFKSSGMKFSCPNCRKSYRACSKFFF